MVVVRQEPVPKGVDLNLIKDILEVGPQQLKRARHLQYGRNRESEKGNNGATGIWPEMYKQRRSMLEKVRKRLILIS